MKNLALLLIAATYATIMEDVTQPTIMEDVTQHISRCELPELELLEDTLRKAIEERRAKLSENNNTQYHLSQQAEQAWSAWKQTIDSYNLKSENQTTSDPKPSVSLIKALCLEPMSLKNIRPLIDLEAEDSRREEEISLWRQERARRERTEENRRKFNAENPKQKRTKFTPRKLQSTEAIHAMALEAAVPLHQTPELGLDEKQRRNESLRESAELLKSQNKSMRNINALNLVAHSREPGSVSKRIPVNPEAAVSREPGSGYAQPDAKRLRSVNIPTQYSRYDPLTARQCAESFEGSQNPLCGLRPTTEIPDASENGNKSWPRQL